MLHKFHITPMPATVNSHLVILTIPGEIEGQAQWWPMHFGHNWAFVQLLCLCVAALHFECAVSCWHRCPQSPGFIKWWARWLSLNVAKAQHSQTCKAVSDTCLSQWGLFTSLSLNGCPFKWLCLVNSPIIVCSWFLLRVNSSPVYE
jgi:hypothetical protein